VREADIFARRAATSSWSCSPTRGRGEGDATGSWRRPRPSRTDLRGPRGAVRPRGGHVQRLGEHRHQPVPTTTRADAPTMMKHADVAMYETSGPGQAVDRLRGAGRVRRFGEGPSGPCSPAGAPPRSTPGRWELRWLPVVGLSDGPPVGGRGLIRCGSRTGACSHRVSSFPIAEEMGPHRGHQRLGPRGALPPGCPSGEPPVSRWISRSTCREAALVEPTLGHGCSGTSGRRRSPRQAGVTVEISEPARMADPDRHRRSCTSCERGAAARPRRLRHRPGVPPRLDVCRRCPEDRPVVRPRCPGGCRAGELIRSMVDVARTWR